MADKLKAGTIWVNTYRAVSYMSPFGGYKRSGQGRESGQECIKEFLKQNQYGLVMKPHRQIPLLSNKCFSKSY